MDLSNYEFQSACLGYQVILHNVCRNLLLALYLSASRATTFVARYAISFFNTSLLSLQNPLFMCPVTKLAVHIALLHHFVSNTEQHIESLKGDTLFMQQLFEGCFHNFLSIATDYFHRLRTHLVSLLNRLLFPTVCKWAYKAANFEKLTNFLTFNSV